MFDLLIQIDAAQAAIEDCKSKDIARFESELPTLKEIVSRQWNKTAELEELKKECADLQRRIDESLKAVENGETNEEPKPQMSDEINDLERA